MKTWDYASAGAGKKETGCCNLDSFNDARLAAVQNGFPHFVLDIREEFGDFVIENFVEEYLRQDAQSCVFCNTHIKWKALLKRADTLKAPRSSPPGIMAKCARAGMAVIPLPRGSTTRRTRAMSSGACSRIFWRGRCYRWDLTARRRSGRWRLDFGYPEPGEKE